MVRVVLQDVATDVGRRKRPRSLRAATVAESPRPSSEAVDGAPAPLQSASCWPLSTAAFGQLAGRWSPRLLRHAQRLLGDRERARDAVQEAWLSVARDLRRLDDPAHFPAWAFAIVTRRCIDALRRTVREHRLTAAAVEAAATDAAAFAGPAVEARLDLASAIAGLPLDQRLMVRLHYGEGLGVEEIAVAHGVPSGTVKLRLHAARYALRSFLEGADDDQS